MSNKSLLINLVIGLTILLGCSPDGKESVKADNALSISAENYTGSANYRVDMSSSVIEWSGEELISRKSHRGRLKLNQSYISVDKGVLNGGTFEIDMKSLWVVDLKTGKGKEKLEQHLNSPDFFSVDKYPSATFTIAKVVRTDTIRNANAMVSGNLTIKGITKSINIPASININDSYITVISPTFSINRTDWDIMHRSGLIGTAKDKIISDLISLRLRIKADNLESQQEQESEPTQEAD